MVAVLQTQLRNSLRAYGVRNFTQLAKRPPPFSVPSRMPSFFIPVLSPPVCWSKKYATLPIKKYEDNNSQSYPTGTNEASSQPFKLVEAEIASVYEDIRAELNCDLPELVELAQYYFSAHGKAFRPVIVLLMAAVCARQKGGVPDSVLQKQKRVAIIAEMIHTASLIHDDVIDEADTRRKQPSLHKLYGEKRAILTGDYILSVASRELARLRNPDVIICISQIIEDLVKGELMQIGSQDASVTGRLGAYLSKTYHKTASLMANTCKAVALLAECPQEYVDRSFLFGKNLGMAFQLVDDNLDFVATADEMGKPTSVDLSLGLATAPVLLAAEKAPELIPMIERRFGNPGDVLEARKIVFQHGGVDQTKILAARYSEEAVMQLNAFPRSEEHDALIKMCNMVLSRSN